MLDPRDYDGCGWCAIPSEQDRESHNDFLVMTFSYSRKGCLRLLQAYCDDLNSPEMLTPEDIADGSTPAKPEDYRIVPVALVHLEDLVGESEDPHTTRSDTNPGEAL